MKCLSLVACGGATEIQMTAPGKDPELSRVLGLQLFNLQCFYTVLKLIQSARRCSGGLRMFEGQVQKTKNAPHINLRTSNVRANKVVPEL